MGPVGAALLAPLLAGLLAQDPAPADARWAAIAAREPGPDRASAVGRALKAGGGPLSADHLRLAWEVAVEEATALRLDGARAIQRVLHDRYAAVWSAMDLSLTLQRLGEEARADACLASQIAREESAGRPSGALWSQRGILALGSGDERRARDYLGLGCARGSADAGVVLARLDLDRGRLPAARAGFRALLLDDDPSPWAPRGWGLALLPQAEGAAGSTDQAY